jgi:hypothetical protein
MYEVGRICSTHLVIRHLTKSEKQSPGKCPLLGGTCNSRGHSYVLFTAILDNVDYLCQRLLVDSVHQLHFVVQESQRVA